MAYKPGVALAASVTLLIGSIALFVLYVACSALNCSALASSYGSPIWTGILILTIAFVGIFMSTTKSEKGCGVLFLILSIFGIVVTLACMGLTLYTSFVELLAPINSSSVYGSSSTVPINTTQATPTATPINPVTGFILWILMLTVAFILSIVTCVTSCQYCCCCQEHHVPQQTFVVVQQGAPNQNILVENTTILSQPQVQGPKTVYLAQPPNQYVQQPFPGQQVIHTFPTAPQQFIGQPTQSPPPPYAAQPTASYSNSSQNVSVALPAQSHQLSPSAPPIPQDPHVQHPGHQQSTHIRYPSQNQSSIQAVSGNVASNEDYQPLIHDAHQTSSTNQQPRATSPRDVNVASAIQHTYAQADGDSTTDDGSYLDPNPPTNDNTDLNSRLYEYIEDPAYDYANPEDVPKDLFSGETSADYVNRNIDKRPKAPTPAK